MPFIYITDFQEDSKWGKVVGDDWVGMMGHNYLFSDFGFLNFSQYLWSSFLLAPNGVYYDCHFYLDYHYHHHYCYGYYF